MSCNIRKYKKSIENKNNIENVFDTWFWTEDVINIDAWYHYFNVSVCRSLELLSWGVVLLFKLPPLL